MENIVSYKKYCDSIGVEFLFLPIPNKETVYYKNVPFETQPDYLFKIDSILNYRKVESINSLKIFNDSKKYVYHKDDTHWNYEGVNLIANEIVNFVNKSKTNNKGV